MKIRRLSFIMLAALLVQFVPGPAHLPVYAQSDADVAAQYTLPDEQVVTLEPALRYGGQLYRIHYMTTGTYRESSSRFIALASPEFYANQSITALLVTVDGQVVTDEDTLWAVFVLYRAAHALYVEQTGNKSLVWVDDDFVEEMHGITQNPLFITQAVGALFKGRQEEIAGALRGMLTSDRPNPDDVTEYAQLIRGGAERGDEILDVIDSSVKTGRFSTNLTIRKAAKGLQKLFKSWQPVTEQGTSFFEVGGTRLELTNALELASLSVRLMWLADLQKERAEWLVAYNGFATGDAALDRDQLAAGAEVTTEVDNSWIQREDIILDFVREQGGELLVKVPAEKLVEKLALHTFKVFGKEIKGYLVAGVASAVMLGFTIGDLIYGLDDLYDNFKVAERADELRRKFRAGRQQLEAQANAQTDQTYYDARLAGRYRAAYLLEALAAVQMIHSYADGVQATVRKNLLSIINPISWFKGKEFNQAAEELHQTALQGEEDAENTLGHPVFVDTAISLVLRRVELIRLMVDDAQSRFTRTGLERFWQTAEGGYAGSMTWTKNETGQIVNAGRWTPRLETAGIYQLRAYIPPPPTTLSSPYTASAHYRIAHAGTTTEVVRNQAELAGKWLDLGLYYFEDAGDEYVELVDQTGEPAGSTLIIFDALQWMPVDEPPANAYDAALAPGSLPYDVVISGETAVLTFTVQNTGLIPWPASTVILVGDTGNTKSAPGKIEVDHKVRPGEAITLTVSFPISGTVGIVNLTYQAQRSDQDFGQKLSGFVVILLPELGGLKERVRKQVEEWKRQGQQAIEDLLREIQKIIQEEAERQARKAVKSLCGGPTATLVLFGIFVFTRPKRKRDT